MLTLLMAFSLVALPLTADPKKEVDRLDNCGMVLKEIMDIPDDIPSDLIDKAECVIVIPSVLKVAFAFSGSYGRGAMPCRTGEHFTGPWSAPAMMRLEGGGFGLQLGGQATDFVILVMNPRGAKALLKSKVKLGADAAAAAGPKGRDAAAASDVTMRAEMLTYSRSRGLFAGVSLEGSTLRPDNGSNETLYGKKGSAENIIRKGAVAVPPAGQEVVALLNQKAPKRSGERRVGEEGRSRGSPAHLKKKKKKLRLSCILLSSRPLQLVMRLLCVASAFPSTRRCPRFSDSCLLQLSRLDSLFELATSTIL